MKKRTITALALVISLLVISCQSKTKSAATIDKTAVADSAKAVAQRIIDNSNKLDFEAAFNNYSADADARYTENGTTYPSLAAMKDAYKELMLSFEILQNSVKSWDVMVLDGEAAMVTLPIHAKLKVKDRDAIEIDYVWSALVQKRNGRWLVVQTHESWVNADKAMAALFPPPAN